MTESKVFTDNFSRSFTEPGDFFQFLSDRKARSKWMTAPSRELQFEPVERGSTLGNLYMQIYDHNGAAEILEDTMENTSLLLKVDGKDYPVRSCAIKTVLERARISGHALNKVSKPWADRALSMAARRKSTCSMTQRKGASCPTVTTRRPVWW